MLRLEAVWKSCQSVASLGGVSGTIVVSMCCILGLFAQAPPKLNFEWHHDLSYSAMVKNSSAIVIGRVQSLDFVGPTVQAMDDLGNSGMWQLLRVTTNVENTFRGTLEGPSVTFYFYMWLGGATGDWNALSVGHRYIFFLTVDKGVLRAIRDYARSSIEVGSGRHATALTHDEDIKTTVATLLLTPGDGMQPARFHRLLLRAVPLAIEWIGSCKTARLLESLLANSSKEVRDSAREQLSNHFGKEDPCVQQ